MDPLEIWMLEFNSIVDENIKDSGAALIGSGEVMDIFYKMPYQFDPEVPLKTFRSALEAGAAGCGEAAAALAAALTREGVPYSVCVKKDSLTNSAHVTIMTDTWTFDPYESYFARGINGCYIKS